MSAPLFSPDAARRGRWRWLVALGAAALLAGAASVPGQPPAKAPVPDKAAQAKAEQLVRDIFAEDVDKATEPAARAKLAAVLMQQAREVKGEPALRFVLYREARDLAGRAGDVGLALAAIEEITRQFDVDAAALKADALLLAVRATTGAEESRALVELLLPMMAEAVDLDNYKAAEALGKLAEEAARRAKSASLVLEVRKRAEAVAAAEKGYQRVNAYLQRLKDDPMDAEANRALGEYFGYLKRRWAKALPYLANGGAAELAKLARADLAGPKDARARAAVADGWWEYAAAQKEPARTALQARAAHWYDMALPQLSGLARTKAQRRVEAVSERLAGSTGSAPAGPVGEIKKLEGHTDEIKGVAFAPDGRHAASAGLDQTVRLWDLAAGKEERVLRGHTKQVWAVAFHPNGRQLFSASWDATVRQWDVKNGNEGRRFTHGKDVNGLALSRDGGQMLVGCDDQNAYLWNVATGEEVRRFGGHSNYVYCVAFSPDGRHVASGGVDKTVRVHDLNTGQAVKVFEGHTNSVTAVAFSADGRHVFSAGDPVIHQWEVATGKEARKFEGHNGPAPGMALSPDGRRLATGGDDKTVRLWDVATGKELHRFQGHGEAVNCVAFSADGRRLVSGGVDRTVRLWGLPAR